VFITNNSSYTADLLIDKLKKMNIPAKKENILTSSIATAKYLKQSKEQVKCFMIGEIGLKQALEDENIMITKRHVTYDVMEIDRQITYNKLEMEIDCVI